jgi:hypothetical protein
MAEQFLRENPIVNKESFMKEVEDYIEQDWNWGTIEY